MWVIIRLELSLVITTMLFALSFKATAISCTPPDCRKNSSAEFSRNGTVNELLSLARFLERASSIDDTDLK